MIPEVTNSERHVAVELEVESGAIVAMRLFDVAYGIDLARVESLWTRQPGAQSTRNRLTTAPAKAVAFGARYLKQKTSA